jgi:hypothetical protein
MSFSRINFVVIRERDSVFSITFLWLLRPPGAQDCVLHVLLLFALKTHRSGTRCCTAASSCTSCSPSHMQTCVKILKFTLNFKLFFSPLVHYMFRAIWCRQMLRQLLLNHPALQTRMNEGTFWSYIHWRKCSSFRSIRWWPYWSKHVVHQWCEKKSFKIQSEL